MSIADVCVEDAWSTFHRHLFSLPYDAAKCLLPISDRRYIAKCLRSGGIPGVNIPLQNGGRIVVWVKNS